jgi:hypothetical protein
MSRIKFDRNRKFFSKTFHLWYIVYPEIRVCPIILFVFPTELMTSMIVCYLFMPFHGIHLKCTHGVELHVLKN